MESEISVFEQFASTLWERDVEMEYIHNAFQETPKEHGIVYYFHGISGVGKSKLCDYTRRYIQAQFQAPFAMVNIDMSNILTEVQIIRKIYRVLHSHAELTFPRYEAASAYLFAVTGDPVYKIDPPSNTSTFMNTIYNLASELGVSALELAMPANENSLQLLSISLASTIAEQVLNWAFSTVDHKLHKHIVDKRQNSLEQFYQHLRLHSPNEIQQKLSLYFIDDIEEALDTICTVMQVESYQLLVTIDSFEKRLHTSSCEYFFQQLFERIGRSTWFLFGTETTIPQQSSQTIIMHSYSVLLFNTERLRIYLEQQGVTSTEDQTIIINASDGLPAAVQMMLDIYKHNNGRLDKLDQVRGYDALFDQYFRRHLSEDEQKIFQCLALFDYWDQDIFSYIVPFSEMRNQMFNDIIHKTALVVRSSTSTTENVQYCLVDIVKKTILNRRETAENGMLMDAYRMKFNYEKAVSDQYLEQLKHNIVIGQELYEKLSYHCISAFRAGLESYCNKSEFEAISSWCTKSQQSLSKRGLYFLKADLTKLYLELVQQRDGFIYDTDDDENKRFRFRNMRDRIWALRYSTSGRKATSLAGEYYAELLTQFGINCSHIPFATYLWGLTFYDIGDYETAHWLLEQSINVNSISFQDTQELNSSISTVAHNALGCLKMDLGQFELAENDFLMVQNIRSSTDVNGQKNTYNNLARLYFRWAQTVARTEPSSKKILEYLTLCKENLNEYERLLEKSKVGSIVDQYNVICRNIILAVAQDRLLGKIGAVEPKWRRYFECLENAVIELKGNTIVPAKVILSINHNIAVMHALQKQFDMAQQELTSCVNAAEKIYFDIDIRSQNAKNKPAIRELNANLRAVTRYLEGTCNQFDPYDFYLQF